MSVRVRLVLVVLAAVLLASTVRNIKEEGDFRGYLEVGELVLAGRDIYADARPDVNTWPPLYSVVCVPFALLARPSVYLARTVWLVLNVVAMGALVAIGVRLVYGRALVARPAADGVSLASAAVLGPLVLTSRFFLGTLDRLQINVLILLACLAACLALVRGRDALAGALVGLGAAIKVLPIFFLPYFLWKRRWRALAAAIATGLAATFAPILVFGPARFWSYLWRWVEIASGGWPVRKGNQSVYAMLDRLYTHGVLVWSPAQTRLTASDDPVVAAAVYGLLAVVAVVLVVVGRRGGRAATSPAVVTELAIVLTVTVLFSPLAWKHYFVFLWLAYLVLWRAALGSSDPHDATPDYGLGARQKRRLRGLIAVSFFLTTLTVRGVVGKTLSLTLETLSAVTLGALVVLVALLYLRALLGEREACASTPNAS